MLALQRFLLIQRPQQIGSLREALKDCTVVVVYEDWEGGAGNGLGTLYAYQKACKKNPAVATMLAEGKSVTLFHTAGKGTRLARPALVLYTDRNSTEP